MNQSKILIVIPARGQSKGIPRKNLRLMAGKPLISYAIDIALRLKSIYNADVAVDTDDLEIAEVVSGYGVEVVMRPESLAGDAVTLDPVIYHATKEMEIRQNIEYDIVITMQATSPTLKYETVKNALELFAEREEEDTLISVTNSPHLSWKKKQETIVPNYTERLNRQQLPADYKDTGGFLMTRRKFVSEVTRFGDNIAVYEVDSKEAVDIDTDFDWIVCEALLSSKRIILRTDGEERLGMGHIYRCLSIAYHLTGHEILFVTNKNAILGVEKIKASFFPMKQIENENDMYEIVKEFQPDIVVNDILNTSKSYILELRKNVNRIVNFEDMGDGADFADCVINAVYEDDRKPNHYTGFEYFFIRDEFFEVVPKEFSNEVKNIVVLFGGSDPSNLTGKIYEIFQEISEIFHKIEFHIITGFGYRYKNEIEDDREHHIFIHNDVKLVSRYLQRADLAITSQGRTIYELAYMGVPTIVLAQNKRETEHIFASMTNGFINLGIGKQIEKDTIKNTIEWLIHTPMVRREMRDLQLSKDYSNGQKRVLKLILGGENV